MGSHRLCGGRALALGPPGLLGKGDNDTFEDFTRNVENGFGKAGAKM